MAAGAALDQRSTLVLQMMEPTVHPVEEAQLRALVVLEPQAKETMVEDLVALMRAAVVAQVAQAQQAAEDQAQVAQDQLFNQSLEEAVAAAEEAKTAQAEQRPRVVAQAETRLQEQMEL